MSYSDDYYVRDPTTGKVDGPLSLEAAVTWVEDACEYHSLTRDAWRQEGLLTVDGSQTPKMYTLAEWGALPAAVKGGVQFTMAFECRFHDTEAAVRYALDNPSMSASQCTEAAVLSEAANALQRMQQPEPSAVKLVEAALARANSGVSTDAA
ncbi:hypothetical protein A3709_19015 [Halioglobus sp. HI00S01]|uniref:hypothetical protein n=1 Tax=Halioglobus sp. HI00S01 TaxID=1822214 RepID=UPI0007C3CC32|nr:hypothetical protein [Halioglobus sp. HI00S01]KZX57716.1 hypothetical protein A3709_19015 [Halioglobus sp. HI00S01]